MARNTYETRNPAVLKNHPLNIELYGDKPNDEFVASVKEHGVLEPIQIMPDNTIISGHRRNQAAKINRLKEVRVVVRNDLADNLDAELALLECNRQREKTNEERAREFRIRAKIEQQIAERRMLAGKRADANTDPEVNLPQGPKSGVQQGVTKTKSRGEQAGDTAAKSVGWSRRTAEKAAEVSEAIEKAEQAGDTKTASELRETLENESVSAAHRRVAPPKRPRNGQAVSPAKLVDELSRKHVGPLVRGIDSVAKVNGGKGEYHAAANDALKNLIASLKKMREGEQ